MTGMLDYELVLEEAADIAERASKIALSYFRQALLIEMKENHTPVTIADKKTEEMIREELSQVFPNHGILGEEFGEQGSDSDYVWTVDPIDGTRSFIRGIPLFGTLLGLLERGEPVIGVMVLPALDETYLAAKGMGAFCDGVQLHVSATQTLESSVISCGDYPCFEAIGKKHYLQKLMERAELVRGYTDCFGHSLLLRGAVDAMVDPVVSPWDVAPLACLVREAGGDYFTFEGERTHAGKSFISCTPALRDELLKLG
jgi:histidinol phosphatase-like enzyme (inositol monophosphatase family)